MDEPEWNPTLREALSEITKLRHQHKDGDPLAAMEVCSLWRQRGYDTRSIPNWVIYRLIDLAADYIDASPLSQVTPRTYIDMDSKDRAKITPSLDRLAELTGTKGKDNAWLMRVKVGRHPHIVSFVRDAERRAQAGENEREIDVGTEKRPASVQVRVLDKDGRITGEFKNAVARAFKVASYNNSGSDQARTIDRILKVADGK